MPMIVRLCPLSVIGFPMSWGSPPNRFCQNERLNSTTSLRPAASSSGRKRRPSSGRTRRMGKNVAETRKASTRSGLSRLVRLKSLEPIAARFSNTWFCACQSTKVPGATLKVGKPNFTLLSCNRTNRSGSGKESGRNKTPFTTLKMAVFAPMPSASVSTATAVKPGFLSNWRKANLRSFITQRLHWIDLRRAECRQTAGHERDHSHQQTDENERHRVGRSNAEQQARQEAREGE